MLYCIYTYVFTHNNNSEGIAASILTHLDLCRRSWATDTSNVKLTCKNTAAVVGEKMQYTTLRCSAAGEIHSSIETLYLQTTWLDLQTIF